MRCLAAGKTIKGKIRDINEDTIYINTEYGVFAVADGMGGHAAGEVASTIAINALANRVRFANKLNPREFLKSVFDEANWEIIETARCSPEKRGMGTTLSILYIKGEKYYIGHVGDSRVYLVRNDELYQLTEDDTQVNILVKRGMLTPKEAVNSPQAGVLTKAVGTSAHLMPTFYEGDIQSRDIFLLTSDGFHDLVDEEVISKDEIINILRFNSTDKAAEQLVDIANNRSGHDNISVIVVKPLKVKRIKYTLHKISTALKFAMGFLFAVIVGMVIYRFDIISQFRSPPSDLQLSFPVKITPPGLKVWIRRDTSTIDTIDTTPLCGIELPPGEYNLSYIPASFLNLFDSSSEVLRELWKDTTIKLSDRDTVPRDTVPITLDYPWRLVYIEFNRPIDTTKFSIIPSCEKIKGYYKLQVGNVQNVWVDTQIYKIVYFDPRIDRIEKNCFQLHPDTFRFIDTVKFQVEYNAIMVKLRTKLCREGNWVYKIGGKVRNQGPFAIGSRSRPTYPLHIDYIDRPQPNESGELIITYWGPSRKKKTLKLIVTHQTPRIDTILK